MEAGIIKMKIALMSNNRFDFERVYKDDVLSDIANHGELSTLITKENLIDNLDFLKDAEYIFTTWGMPVFSEAEIREYMPSLKGVFYAAGSVQYFAKPFLDNGIKVYSAFSANAVPVAEYVFSLISLSTKGFFQASRMFKLQREASLNYGHSAPGNYKSKIGIVGLGAIGSLIAEKLKSLDVDVLAYDPFIPQEKADSLQVKLVNLETIFTQCDVISNHLANKVELNDIFNDSLFSLMKQRATFINTGRGAQVDEKALAKALKEFPMRTAIIDVLKDEQNPRKSPLFWCDNVFMTPHLAGSSGNETQRMARYMADEFERILNNENPSYEVTSKMLKTMA